MENDDVEMLGADNNEAVCNAFHFPLRRWLNFPFDCGAIQFEKPHLWFTHQCLPNSQLVYNVNCDEYRNWMTWRSAWRKWKTKLLLCGICRPRSRKRWDLCKVAPFNALFSTLSYFATVFNCLSLKMIILKFFNSWILFFMWNVICVWYELGWIGYAQCWI